MSEPIVSVAIPVLDAGTRLERTLESIAASTGIDLSRVEVVLADDGSTDGAVGAVRCSSYPYRITIERGAWGSQSAATNAAVARCRGRYVLLSAQDIRFDAAMIGAHLAAHERFAAETLGIAVLGELPYAPESDTTPFMFYLVNGGYQFAYFLIQDPHHVPPNFLYAPNVSIRRETFERVGGFDEAFPYGLQDTELGIRLADAGVRLVHEPAAIGVHDHPTTLGAFRSRMARIAPSRLVLEEKHPHHEPAVHSWDLAISACLAYDDRRLELDLALIDQLEPAVHGRPSYRPLWQRSLRGANDAEFDDDERLTVELTKRLFSAYGRVLQASWSGAYLDAAIERFGIDETERLLGARLARLQATRPAYRIVEAGMRSRGLRVSGLAPVHCRSARVVHGIRDRATALAVLERFIPPAAGAVDQELVLVTTPGALDPPELAELERSAVVVVDEPKAALARVASSVDAPILIVTDAASTLDECRTVELVERVFERFPLVAAIGGAVIDPDGRIRYGATLTGDRLTPLSAGPSAERGAQPIDVPLSECLVLRREIAAALGRTAPGPSNEPWPATLGRLVRESGAMLLHVPDLAATCVASNGPTATVRHVDGAGATSVAAAGGRNG